jgi:hypothetical protein
MLEIADGVEDAIFPPHGIDPFRVQMIRIPLESIRINAVHFIKHNVSIVCA